MENVLLIGAGGGIGSAIEKKLKIKYNLDSYNSKLLDLSNEESVERFKIKNTKEYNHIVFSSGINSLASFDKVTKGILKKTLDINLINFLVILSSLLKKNLNRKTRTITMISSLYGSYGRKSRLPYVISKHALNGACKTLSIELGKENIRVNSISPGFIDTKLTRKNLSLNEIKNIESKVPLKKLGQPQDIANVVSFLMSEQARYISGADIVVDGGFSSGGFMGV